MKNKIVWIVAVMSVTLLVVISPAFRLWRFEMHGEAYYAKIAEACDELLKKHVPGEGSQEIRGEQIKLLPEVLRDLRPEYVTVYSDRVMIRLPLHNVFWVSDKVGTSFGELSSNSEARRRVLFSKRESDSFSSIDRN